MNHDRSKFLQLAVLTAAMLLAVGAVGMRLAPDRAVEMVDNATRFHWEARFDVLFVGDSRTHDAIAPAYVSPSLQPLKVGNYGWGGLGWSQEILNSAASKLDPDGARILVLGITPYGFTRKTTSQNVFLDTRASHPLDRWVLRSAPLPANFFAPWGLSWAFRKLNPELGQNAFKLHEDGWYEAMPPKLLGTRVLKAHIDGLRASPVEQALLERTCEQIRVLEARGVRVFGYRPPASDEMARVEVEVGKFDPDQVLQALQTAGLEFIEVRGSYETYDGSHLPSGEAKRFSEALGAQLAKLLNDSK